MECARFSTVYLLVLHCYVCIVHCQQTVTVTEHEDETLKIRLRDGNNQHEGRVEIKHKDEWGTICDDDWDIHAANVVCKMLGYVSATSFVHSGKFGPGEGPILLDNVHCSGDEDSLLKCEIREFGDHDCSHHEDAGVQCNPQRLPEYLIKTWKNTEPSFDEMRLKPPRGMKKRMPQIDGYLEMFIEGKWRNVCSEGWTHETSRIACGQLGFPDASVLGHMYNYLKKGKHRNYWLTNVTCNGDESSLSQCSFTKLNLTNHVDCPTNTPVILRCTPGDFYSPFNLKKHIKNAKRKKHHKTVEVKTPLAKIRVKGGASVGEGRLEVMHDGRWGTVCHRGFDMKDANVACRELGFGTAKRFYINSYFGNAHGPIWLSNLECTGHEDKLFDCRHEKISKMYTGYGEINPDECTHFEEAGIACHVPAMSITERIRLVGGRNPMEGRIEVQIARKWGAVCSDDWGSKEAMVVCRQLGLGYALHALTEVWYYPGSENTDGLVMTGVKCKGDEMALQYCKHDGKNISKCGDTRKTMTPFAGVICTDGAPDLILDIPMLESSIHMEDRGLSQLLCAAEENCLSSSADNVDLTVSYGIRRLLRFSSRVWNRGRADFRPAKLPNDWIWHQCHGHFHSMAEFTHYDITSLNKTKVAEGHKASFCLEDTHCDPDVSARYDCDQPGGGVQGITVGCSDTYAYNIDCQWIDITDLVKGNYLLKVHINPQHLVPESDFSNNEVICNLQYTGQEVFIWNCHISDDYDPIVTAKYYSQAMFP